MFAPHVRSLRLRAFATHDDLSLELPPHGVVLLTGENGAGKSTLIEAVSRALWNEPSAAGIDPWREDAAGEVEVVTDRHTVTRRRTAKGRGSLEWHRHGEETTAWETATKAQEALERDLGPHALWLRRHVFAGREGSYFASASDAERKRLLETMIGLDVFDAALARGKARRRAVTEALTAARAVVGRAEGALTLARRAAEPTAAPPRTFAPDAQDTLRAAVDTARDTHREAESRAREAEGVARAATREAERARERLRALTAGAGACPSCLRPYDTAPPDPDAVREAEAEVAATESRAREAATEAREVRETVARTGRALEAAERDVLRYDVEVAAYDAWTAREAARSAAAVTEAEAALQAALDPLAALEHRDAVMAAAEQAMGVRGARAVLLADALPGLSAAASAWVHRLGREWTIRLLPTTERGSGRVETIALEIDTGSRVTTYRALSGGEKKRVDLALLHALGDLAADAAGEGLGTLFYDEALDSPLDAAGAALGAEVLTELARERCVVLIAHDAGVMRAAEPARHYHLAAGALQRVR